MRTKTKSNTAKSGGVFRPMLFSTLMVQALLNGTKRQTRRIVKAGFDLDETTFAGFKHDQAYFKVFNDMWLGTKVNCNIGDVIWVRETYFDTSNVPKAELFKGVGKYVYKADNAFIGSNNWRPSLFMTKEACRLWLKVTGVRVERLQDISGEDAIQEGVIIDSMWPMAIGDAYRAYQTLWEKINGKGSWDDNPFVWVYEFEVLTEAPDGFR